MKFLTGVGNAITKINWWIARVASYLIYPIIAVIIIEVFFRYVLDNPTPYTYDPSWMMYGALIFLGGAYALADDVHVRADIFYNMLKNRGKFIINVICYPLFFFSAMAALLYATYTQMINAWVFGEMSTVTSFRPPMGPIRTVLFFSFVILTLQGIVKFAGIIKTFFTGGEIK